MSIGQGESDRKQVGEKDAEGLGDERTRVELEPGSQGMVP